MEAFLGTILAVGFNYAPRGWAFCNGQLLAIAQNSALFSLLGTTYGGDGRTTFALPDLRGRTVVGGQANGPGLTPIQMGQMAGTNHVTVIGSGAVSISLTSANLPAHTHPASMSPTGLTATTTLAASTGTSGGLVPAAGTLLSGTAGGPSGAAIYVPPAQAGTTVDLGGINTTLDGAGSVTVGANTGGGAPLAAPVQTQAQASVMQPYTGLNYIIALQGIFPSRN
ncbi:MAG: tail fiber protein [Ramlibacter sp.]|nr:tail fiber protein [Ramlibacter sp.]MCW5651588.1 tail fiber protein [Ramlibacter sp.]